MTRLSIPLLTLSLLACESTDGATSSPLEANAGSPHQFVDTPSELPGSDVASQEQGDSPDLICASGGLFDPDGQLETVRMSLFQRAGTIEVHVSKGALHPSESDVFKTAVLQMDGQIGSEFLRLNIDEEHSISEQYELNTAVGIELARLELEDQVFYRGMFTQFGCGPYGGSLNSVTCWEPDIEPVYSYNTLNGVCLNAEKEMGYNPWTIEMIRETGDGQCADLVFVELNEGDVAQPEFSWDLRGSDLQYAQLNSAVLLDARLEGAQMDELYFYDSRISGSIDDFTRLPQGCEENGSDMVCTR